MYGIVGRHGLRRARSIVKAAGGGHRSALRDVRRTVEAEWQLDELDFNLASIEAGSDLGVDSVIDSAGRSTESVGTLRRRDFDDWLYPGGLSAAWWASPVVGRFI
jgi:hypothetical protein